VFSPGNPGKKEAGYDSRPLKTLHAQLFMAFQFFIGNPDFAPGKFYR
jgi:hypothetical protein